MNEPIFISNETAMIAFGESLAKKAKPGDIIFLQGELGAGKTTLVRGFLNGFGIQESIKSPTFTLVETYQVDKIFLFHFDLYRLVRPEQIFDMGLNDYLTEDAICLIEWPEKASEYLPAASCYCTIEIPDNGEGRWITFHEIKK